MGKDKIRPDNLGKLFFLIYKSTVSFNNRILESLKNVDSQAILPQDEQIMIELDFLHIYAIYKAFFSRFKSYYEIFEKNFRKEYGSYIREKMTEESALEYEMNLSTAISGYMEKHNETLAKGTNTEAQIEFGRYTSHRIIGDKHGDDIRYIMLLYSSLSTNLIELVRIIDTSIEIIE